MIFPTSLSTSLEQPMLVAYEIDKRQWRDPIKIHKMVLPLRRTFAAT